ncbi:hypothetical protein AC578_2916 [Pseudocercospora eumusae]|uniref:Uncharacterized protein n=1 Tax=Pseudocercospora eumusae TaxID=321146 RepID=A0A139HEM9_9PEZI|nr:hypothetical protein AC578_2916 [Pseudocercospora eumusae]
MVGVKQVFLAATLSVLALAGPLEKRQDDTGCTFHIDLVNDCQKMYGGYWDICKNATNTFDIPDCNGETGKKKICEYYLVEDCKKTYGGCYNDGDPEPTFEKPTCP